MSGGIPLLLLLLLRDARRQVVALSLHGLALAVSAFLVVMLATIVGFLAREDAPGAPCSADVRRLELRDRSGALQVAPAVLAAALDAGSSLRTHVIGSQRLRDPDAAGGHLAFARAPDAFLRAVCLERAAGLLSPDAVPGPRGFGGRGLARAPGVSVTNVSGRGHYVFIMHCNTAPFDNKDLRLALKYAINRQELVDKILDGFGSVGNDIPINKAYPLFDATLPQREFSLEKAAEHYKASGHDGSPIEMIVADGAFPGAVDAAALFQQTAKAAGIPLEIKRVPDDGYWSDVWNVKPFCASYWGGRPVQDQMYSTAYVSTADWNDTKFSNKEFDDLVLQARSETDLAKRKELYSKIAKILWEEGGVICPMFNDWVEAHSEAIAGWLPNGEQEMMNGLATSKTWMA